MISKCFSIGFFKDYECKYRATDARVSSDVNGRKVILSNEIELYIEFLLTETQNDNMSPWLREELKNRELARPKGKDIKTSQFKQY